MANIHLKGILQFFILSTFFLFIGCGGNQTKDQNTVGEPRTAHSSVLSADIFPVTVSPLKKHHKEIRLLSWFLNDFHLAKPRVNDEFSVRFFDVLMNDIDPDGMYFTQLDIEQFEVIKWKLDDSISFGYLVPVFQIYSHQINQRLKQMDFYLNKLADESSLTTPSNQNPDLKNARWVRSQEALERVWITRLNRDMDDLKRVGKTTAQAKSLLSYRYQSTKQKIQEESAEDIFHALTNSFTKYIDPHSAYFSPRNNLSKISMEQLDRVGIGMVFGMDGLYANVVRLVDNGPADKTGKIKENDLLIAIQTPEKGYQEVIGWRLDDIITLIRGKVDTKIKLFLQRNSSPQPLEVEVNREEVKLQKIALKSAIKKRNGKSILVVDIPKFYVDFQAQLRGKPEHKVSTDLNRLIALHGDKIDAMVIDIADNSGGPLVEAVNTAGLFVGKKTIVKQRDTKGKITSDNYLVDGIGFNKPIIVMVNASTAGAAEVFAAALQDYGEAIIVGRTTHGMGTVQSLLDLSRHVKETDGSFGTLKLTIGEYYRATGKPFQRVGVIPDIVFSSPSRKEQREVDKAYSLISKNIELSPVVSKALSSEIAALKNKTRNQNAARSSSDIEKAIDIAFAWLDL